MNRESPGFIRGECQNRLKKIEWDDDIDLNYTNSTTEQWERYFKED